jgi:hypothetical protein
VQVKASIGAAASGGLRRHRQRIAVIDSGLVLLGERGELAKAERSFKASAERRAAALFGAVWFVVRFVGLVTQQIPTPKPGERSNGHVGGDVLEFGSVGSGERMKGGGCIISRERENTVRDGDVVVDVEIEATAKSLRK